MNKNKPEWAPVGSGEEFATEVVSGVKGAIKSAQTKKRPYSPTVSALKEGIINGDLPLLARAITLVESASKQHLEQSQKLIKELLPYTGKSIRIAISGPPGAGKSSFIDSIGEILCNNGKKVAVLAVDPSSTLSGGSILGDKTRMERLSRCENAFIRPSPSGGVLGGVARKTRETILLCEAAGFDTIFIETVGVGQSEINVRSMVDFFLLLLLPGSGDELQGVKKGVVEIADALAINKADNSPLIASLTQKAYIEALHYLINEERSIPPKVFLSSAIKGDGIKDIWEEIVSFTQIMKENGKFDKQRKEQTIEWIISTVEENIINNFYSNPEVAKLIPTIKEQSILGKITPTSAVMELLKAYKQK